MKLSKQSSPSLVVNGKISGDPDEDEVKVSLSSTAGKKDGQLISNAQVYVQNKTSEEVFEMIHVGEGSYKSPVEIEFKDEDELSYVITYGEKSYKVTETAASKVKLDDLNSTYLSEIKAKPGYGYYNLGFQFNGHDVQYMKVKLYIGEADSQNRIIWREVVLPYASNIEVVDSNYGYLEYYDVELPVGAVIKGEIEAVGKEAGAYLLDFGFESLYGNMDSKGPSTYIDNNVYGIVYSSRKSIKVIQL